MDFTFPTGIVAGLVKDPALRLFRHLFFGSRVELSYGWSHPLVYFLDDPIRSCRSVEVQVVAGKHGEFLVSDGELQIIRGKKWVRLLELRGVMTLPWTVEKNRSDSRQLGGEVIAEAIRSLALGESGPFQIRINVKDLHRQQAESQPMEVTLEELLRTQITYA